LCSLLLFTCICFHLLPVVISPLLFRQPCSLSSSPVFGSTSHCPITQFPRPSVPLPSGVCSFGSTPPSRDIILLLTVTIRHPSRSIPVIKSSGIRTPVLPSRTYIPFNAAQSLTRSGDGRDVSYPSSSNRYRIHAILQPTFDAVVYSDSVLDSKTWGWRRLPHCMAPPPTHTVNPPVDQLLSGLPLKSASEYVMKWSGVVHWE